jgi:hypothetical protein
MSSVLQEWVMDAGWKMQSILLSGLRGPDDGEAPAIKAVNRWLRTQSQNNADPSKDYMRPDALPTWEALCDELEWKTVHYVHHMADALRVMSLYHPDRETRERAWTYHYYIAYELFHFEPEPDNIFKVRHADKALHP